MLGTLLTRAENVRVAITNGVGLRVCLAANGLCTKIGMSVTENGKRIMDNEKSFVKLKKVVISLNFILQKTIFRFPFSVIRY